MRSEHICLRQLPQQHRHDDINADNGMANGWLDGLFSQILPKSQTINENENEFQSMSF